MRNAALPSGLKRACEGSTITSNYDAISEVSPGLRRCDRAFAHRRWSGGSFVSAWGGSSQQIGSGPDTCDHNEVHHLRLGMDADQGWHFEGELAEVHIYNRALSDPEIALEWNDGKGRKTAVPGGELVAGYRFEDSSGGHS